MRAPLAQDRQYLLPDNLVRIEFKRPFRDGDAKVEEPPPSTRSELETKACAEKQRLGVPVTVNLSPHNGSVQTAAQSAFLARCGSVSPRDERQKHMQ